MRILVAEDDAVSRRLLEAILKQWGHEVIVVEDGRAAWEALANPDAPRLVILDWMMPELDGLEVCKRVRQSAVGRFTYVIILTARDRKADIVAALEAGADDYLMKPYDRGELRARVGVGVRMIRAYEALEEANKRLDEAAHTDYLTGLYNRRALMERFAQELDRATREATSIAALMADVDRFKQINDTYGHSAGDQVLIETAARLRRACRSYDVIGRYGGEEFLVVVVHTPEDVTGALAERLRRAMGDKPIDANGHSIVATLSMGGVWASPGERRDVDAFVKAADAMLYRAKERGRNRLEFTRLSDVAGVGLI